MKKESEVNNKRKCGVEKKEEDKRRKENSKVEASPKLSSKMVKMVKIDPSILKPNEFAKQFQSFQQEKYATTIKNVSSNSSTSPSNKSQNLISLPSGQANRVVNDWGEEEEDDGWNQAEPKLNELKNKDGKIKCYLNVLLFCWF